MVKRIYIYIVITIIFLFILSSIKQESIEGFLIPWYKNDYFVIPLLATLIITGPILYFIYKYVFQRVNETFSKQV